MLRQRPDCVRNLLLALAVTIVSGALVDAGCSRGEGKCGITCTGVSEGLASLIKEQYDRMQDECSVLDSLKVEVSSFPDQTLKSGWLPADVALNGSLTFSYCNFTTIDNDAFEGELFRGVLSLHLFDLTKLRSLQRDHFRSLKNLDTLDMRQLVGLEHIEDGVLNDNVNLATLQFSNGAQNSISRFLANITGNDNQLPHLQTVDLSYNNLGALEPAFFTSFAKSQLAQLYLNAANVTEILPDTIPTTHNFAKLQLSENQMNTLTEDFFVNNHLRADAVFYLDRNPWQCSCDLVWMINKTYIGDDPSCVFPGSTHGILIKNSTKDEMCGDGGQTTSSSTTPSVVTDPITDNTSETTVITTSTTDLTTETVTESTTTETTTQTTTETTTVTVMPPSNGSIWEECVDGGSFSNVDDPDCEHEGAESGTLIQMVECGEKVHVRINKKIQDVDLIVWSNTTQSYNGTCLLYSSASSGIMSFYVTGLSASESFIVCAASTKYGINVKNCGAYTMQPVDALKPWLTNGEKDSYLSAIVGTVVVIFIVSGLVTGLVIRKRPTIIGSNIKKDEFTGWDKKPRTVFTVTPRDYRPRENDDTLPQPVERDHVAVHNEDHPPEPPPRRIAHISNVVTLPVPPRLSQASDKSTISYISGPTQNLSDLPSSALTSAASTPRVSDASSASYISVLGNAWTDTIRSVRRFRESISSGGSSSSWGSNSDSIYERRGSDIPYEQLSPELLLSKTVSIHHTERNAETREKSKPLSRFRVKVSAFAKRKDEINFIPEIPPPKSFATVSSVTNAEKAAPGSDTSIVEPQSDTDIHMPDGVSPRAAYADTKYLRKAHSSRWRSLRKNRVPLSSLSRNATLKAQDLVQKQLHMFDDYTVFEDVVEDDSAGDCVLDIDPSPVTLGVRRELLLANIHSSTDDDADGEPTSFTTPARRRDGLILPPVVEDLLTNTDNPMAEVVTTVDVTAVEDSGCLEFVDRSFTLSSTTSELRRSLEDSIVLEALEKGVSARGRQNADVEERALFRPSGMWNHAPHTWSTTVPKICLQEDLEDASGA